MGKTKEVGPLQYDLEVPAHTLPFEDVLQKLAVQQDSGLSDNDVKTRKDMYGANQLDEGPGVQPFRILVHQVANALTLVSISLKLSVSRSLTDCFAGLDHGYGCFIRHQVLD